MLDPALPLKELNPRKEFFVGMDSDGCVFDNISIKLEACFCTMMIVDAPGDRRAAEKAGALVYPINPGRESASWRRFHDEAFDKFLNLEYAGQFQTQVIAEFESQLPEHPSW